MRRLLKRLLHKLVPRWVAHRIRDRIEDRLNEGPVMEITQEDTGDAIRCQVAGRYSFLLPRECRREIDFHTHTREGRAELSGIAEGALRGAEERGNEPRMRADVEEDAAARLGVIPAFIKLDIESYEYEAIEGARDFLAQHRPELFIELHLNYLEERKLVPRTLVTTLADCGYRFFTYGGTELKPRELYDSPLQGIRFVARG
jgi:hypothetical protein